jgi:hypothetical protein
LERCDYASIDQLALALMECLSRKKRLASGKVGSEAFVNQMIVWVLSDTRMRRGVVLMPWSLLWLIRWQLCGANSKLSRTIVKGAQRDYLESIGGTVREKAERVGLSKSQVSRITTKRVPT